MSRIADAFKLKTHAVALYRAPAIPDGAETPEEHCVLPKTFFECARTGRLCAVAESGTYCGGAIYGFGWEPITDMATYSESLARRGSFRNRDAAAEVLSNIPVFQESGDALVFEDLDDAVREKRPIEVVVFLTDFIGAMFLQQLADYGRTEPGAAAIMPWGQGCQQIYAMPRKEGESENPRAIIGITETFVRRTEMGPGEVTFAVPWKLYERMDADFAESFMGKENFGTVLEEAEKEKNGNGLHSCCS